MKGSLNHNSKLTEDQVREIRLLWKTTRLTQTKIGERFGVSQTAVKYILDGRNWGWIK